MQYSQFLSPNRRQRLVNHGRFVFIILRMMNQAAEIARLVEWAGKRKFIAPYKAYTNTHYHLSTRLAILRHRAPRHYFMATCLHQVSNFVSPRPRLVKGAGAIYRKFPPYKQN